MGKRLLLALGVAMALVLCWYGLARADFPTTQLTFDNGNQGRPDLDDGIVVWKDNRSGNFDIYMYSIATGTESPVAINPAYQNLPVTNGIVVVWQDNRSGNNDIYMKNLLTGITEPLVDGPGNQMLPAISGDKVVYVDNQVSASPTETDYANNIYEVDLHTRAVTPISTAAGSQWEPRISGDRVVWQDYRNGKWDVYMREGPGGAEVPVCTDPGSHAIADISGDRVVWQDYRNGGYGIWMKDLTTGVSQPLTTDTAYKTSPAIYGDLVVWQDYRNDADAGDTLYDYDIYMKDLTTGVESPLASGTTVQAYPSVDKETVVWEQSGSIGYDIWMATVPDGTPPAITNQVPADGGQVGCSVPVIEATLSDNRTGVDPSTVRMELDGEDVSAFISASDEDVNYESPPFTAGDHTVTVTAADYAGNSVSSTWTFHVDAPRLNLPSVTSYWATYQDYLANQITVVYSIGNVSPGETAGSTRLVTSTASSGVMLMTPAPVLLGDLTPGGAADVTVKYQVPFGVETFRAYVYTECMDSCGNTYYYPGPPPLH